MDLNSYLTDFFSLLNNNSNMRGGNNNMFGGAFPTTVTVPLTINDKMTNAEIVEHYFNLSAVPAGKFSVGVTGLTLKTEREAEFIADQVEIVTWMLENGNLGKLKGGVGDGNETKEDLAAGLAAFVRGGVPDVAVVVPPVDGCGVVKVILNNKITDMNWTEADYSDCDGSAAGLDKIILLIIDIVKSKETTQKKRKFLYNNIGSRLLGKIYLDKKVTFKKNNLGSRLQGKKDDFLNF